MKKLILSLICLAAAWGAAAKVELPEIIGSDMVLQQNAQCRLWGWADPRATVRIETSWGAEVHRAKRCRRPLVCAGGHPGRQL